MLFKCYFLFLDNKARSDSLPSQSRLRRDYTIIIIIFIGTLSNFKNKSDRFEYHPILDLDSFSTQIQSESTRLIVLAKPPFQDLAMNPRRIYFYGDDDIPMESELFDGPDELSFEEVIRNSQL